MGDSNRIFVENENHEVVFECDHPTEARRFLRSKQAVPGKYNILSRIEMSLLVEPPRQVHGNRLYGGQVFRSRASKKGQVPENNVDPDIESAIQESVQ